MTSQWAAGTVARLFRTFPAKVAGIFEKILPRNKSRLKQLFQTLFRAKDNHKNLRNYKISYGFHLNVCENIFRPLFCYFLLNSAILRPPIFSGHKQFFGASFELFGRKFGHLAPVAAGHLMGLCSLNK
jgi:hypothetical protein